MPDTNFAGETLGRYRVDSLLGEGGMGAVYRAFDTTLDRYVALKILPPELTHHSDRLERFIREARTASALNHPHLVSVYEVGSDTRDGTPVHFIAMELVEGATLRDRLAGGRLDLRRALQWLSQVADAVAAAHAAGITHRDLKPENIVISNNGYAKVLDFGLAKLRLTAAEDDERTAVKDTDPGVVMGTVGYMSPEQAQGRTADARSDVFSLGCILYEVVAGRRAFQGDSSIDTLHKIINSHPPSLAAERPDAPFELQRIVSKALEKDPDDRYQSVKELSIDLRRLIRELESNPSIITVSSGGHPVVRTSRSPITFVMAAALLIVAIVAIVAAVLWMRRPAEPPPRKAMEITRITSLGTVISASISPDGKLIAYVTSDQGMQGLWLRQIATGRDLELVPSDRQAFWSHTFTNDGNAIVFGVRMDRHPSGAFYEISTLGGTPRHLLDGIDSPPSFSPDGKQMTWVRASFPKQNQSALMLANTDGSAVRSVTTTTLPKRFAPIFFTAPAWSPDGTTIAVSENSFEGNVEARIIDVDVSAGTERVLSDGWRFLSQLTWLPDRSALLAVGERSDGRTQGSQVWRVPLSGAAPEAITADLLDYRSVSLSADGKLLVTVVQDAESSVWRMPFDASAEPERLTRERLDGIRGTAAMRDGSALYATLRTGVFRLVRMQPDGTALDVTSGTVESRYPAPDADDRSMLYVAMTDAGAELRWMSLEGKDERVLATGIDPGPAGISPDGKWAVFADDGRLKKIATSGGPVSEWSLPGVASNPVISPGGTEVAFELYDGAQTRIAVASIDGGPIVWSRPYVGGRNSAMFHWAPDGRGFLLNTMPGDRANIWHVPMEGEPRKLTSFNDQNIGWFDLTPDGKTLVFSRLVLSRDAVLITGF